MSYAFTLATHDPTTAEKALIAGREFYARRFSLGECTDVGAAIQAAARDATEKGARITVRDELAHILPVLNARTAAGSAALTVDEAIAALTDADYRALLQYYAPSLLRAAGVDPNA